MCSNRKLVKSRSCRHFVFIYLEHQVKVIVNGTWEKKVTLVYIYIYMHI